MALNFKLPVNKVCFESLCLIRRQQNSRNRFKDNVFYEFVSSSPRILSSKEHASVIPSFETYSKIEENLKHKM